MSSVPEPGQNDQDPDAALMAQVAAGSQTAFVEIVHRHQNALLNFFIRLGAYSDGEDLVQETFVRVFRYRQKYRPTARFTTFLYVLARHVWADRGRKTMRRERMELELQAEAETTNGAGPVNPAAHVDVEDALKSLSPKLREVLVLNVYQGLRYQEIADVLGVPVGTVKSRVNLAMQALRRFSDES
jgi:RNA polymerase sigma-70 factor, ECF subfamily